jgi:hypothetical protein
VVGVALERPPDDGRERIGGRRGDPQRLVDQLGARGQQFLDPAEIVLAEGEQHLDGQRAVQEPDEQLDEALLRRSQLRRVEQRHELLELVEDQQRAVLLTRLVHVGFELLDGQHIVCVLGGRDALHDQFLADARLDPEPFGREVECQRRRDQSRVDERRLARARVAVQQHAAVDGDQADEAVGLLAAGEEDRVVDVAERMDPPIRDIRNGNRGSVCDDGYGSYFLPSTRS